MSHPFTHPVPGQLISGQLQHPLVEIGTRTYYRGHAPLSWDALGVRYLDAHPQHNDHLVIGNYCSIGQGCQFLLGGNLGCRTEWISTFAFARSTERIFRDARDGQILAGDTCIGHDVWLGDQVVINPGVTIGNGAVIAHCARVDRDIAPYELVSANPDDPVRLRFSRSQIEILQEIAWWHWSDDQLKGALGWLCSADIDGLYLYWQNRVCKPGSPSSGER